MLFEIKFTLGEFEDKIRIIQSGNNKEKIHWQEIIQFFIGFIKIFVKNYLIEVVLLFELL